MQLGPHHSISSWTRKLRHQIFFNSPYWDLTITSNLRSVPGRFLLLQLISANDCISLRTTNIISYFIGASLEVWLAPSLASNASPPTPHIRSFRTLFLFKKILSDALKSLGRKSAWCCGLVAVDGSRLGWEGRGVGGRGQY